MLVNKIQSTNFKAIYEDNSYIETFNDNKLKKDIKNKLLRPYPNDSKGRNYVDYLKEEKGIDILLTKDKKHSLAITVYGVKNAKSSNNKLIDYKNKFNVGKYYLHGFNPNNILETEQNQTQLKIMKITSYILMAITAGMLVINGINRHNLKQLMRESEKTFEMQSAIPDTLKIIKK